MVFRVEKNNNYTTMSNYHFRDTRLSLKAVGLLSKMLYLPDDWKYSIEGLAAICKEGKSAIRSAVEELEECGYIIRHELRDEKGHFQGHEYIVFESPEDAEKSRLSPVCENPTTDNPTSENRTELNTNKLNTNKPTTTTCYDYNSFGLERRHGDNHLVKLTDEDLKKLMAMFGVERTVLMIQRLDYYIAKTGTYYPNHYLTISKWILEDDAKLKAGSELNDSGHIHRDFNPVE